VPSILSQEEEGLAGVKMIALAIAVEPSPILTVSDTEVFHSRAQILELGGMGTTRSIAFLIFAPRKNAPSSAIPSILSRLS
jgi:hypothetical protein